MPVSTEKAKEQGLFDLQLKESLQELDKKEKKNEPKETKERSLSRQISMVRSRSTSELLGDDKGSPRITRHTSRSQLGEYFGSEDEINNEDLSGKVVLHIKTESKELIPRPRIRRSSSVTETHFATQVFSKGSTIRLEVHQSYTIWMIKVIIFDQFGGAEGFDPTSMSLYILPDKVELRNDGTLESYSIPNGSTLLALPTSRKGQLESARRQPFSLKVKASHDLTFAIGRGLSYAIVNFPSTFKIFAVSKQEKYITSFDEKYYIVIEYVNGKKREIADGPMDIGHVDKQGRVTVTYTPTKPGTYIISIHLKKQQICLSPFEVTAIEVDANGAGLKEMSFSGWDIESASILANFSTNPMKHHIIFNIGISVLLHLFGSPIEVIQRDMTKLLTNLLQNEENKIRIATEGGIDLVKKVAKTPYWRNDVNICRYLCRVIVWSLDSSSSFGQNFVQLIGLDFCITMSDSNDIETKRYAVKIINLLCHISENQDAIIDNAMLIELILSLLHHEDMIIQLNSIGALRMILKNYRFLQTINDRKINTICNLIKSKERNLRMEALSILSEVEQQSLVNAYISGDIYLAIYNSLTFETTLLWWEIGIYKSNPQSFLSIQDESDSMPLGAQNYLALKFLNNILVQSTYDQIVGITEHLCEYSSGDVLVKVCKLAGSVDSQIQEEACRLLTSICNHEPLRNKIIQRGLDVWIIGSIRHIDPESHIYVFSAIAKLSASFTNSSRIIDETHSIKILLKLTQSNDQFLQRQAAIILGHLIRNERYKNGILTYGADHLLNLMFQAAGSGELTIHPTYNMSDITIENEIAVGAGQTKVYRGIINGKPCAVKSFDPVHDISFNAQEFQREVFIMSLFQHKRLASCICASTVRPNLFIASKLYTRGSIAELLKKEEIEFPLIIIMLLDIAEGMSFLHSLNIIHRDLKPGNLLVNEDYRITITDFGTTRVAQKRMTATVGTPMYMAPDIINSEAYTTKVDVYSFAVVVWEMIERKIPFPNLSPIETVAAVVNGERPPISEYNPLKDLIRQCWSQNPADRPTFPEIFDELSKIDEKNKSGFASSFSMKDKKKMRRVQSLFGDKCKIEAGLINTKTPKLKNSIVPTSNITIEEVPINNIIIEANNHPSNYITPNNNGITSDESSSNSLSQVFAKTIVHGNEGQLKSDIIITEESNMRSPGRGKRHASLGKNSAKKKQILNARNPVVKPEKLNIPPNGIHPIPETNGPSNASILHSLSISPKKHKKRSEPIHDTTENIAPIDEKELQKVEESPPVKKRESELMRATSIMKFPFQLMKNINKGKESKLSRNSSQLFDQNSPTGKEKKPKRHPKKEEKVSKLGKLDSPHNQPPISPKLDSPKVETPKRLKKKEDKENEKKERKIKKREAKAESKEKKKSMKRSRSISKEEKKKKTSDVSDGQTSSPRNLEKADEESVNGSILEIDLLAPSEDENFDMNSKQSKGRVRSKTSELRDYLLNENIDQIIL